MAGTMDNITDSAAGTSDNSAESAGDINAGYRSVSSADAEACRENCAGLRDFEERISRVQDSAANAGAFCRAVQVDFEVVRCIIGSPQVCSVYHSDFTETSNRCSKIGVDLQQEPVESSFSQLTCTMCSRSLGASLINTYWSKDDKQVGDCEAMCIDDEYCAAFDYDATRSMCRTWSGCPEVARTDRYGCQWTAYMKPDFTPPLGGPVYGVSGQGADQPPPDFDYWATSSSPPTRPPPPEEQQLQISQISSAFRGPFGGLQALHLLCVLVLRAIIVSR
jgi:hypothetical protein